MPSRARIVLLNLLLLLATGALCLLMAEALLRAIGFSRPDFWRTDPVVGLSLRPHASGWVRDEGVAFTRINSHGMRDREHAIPKPANTYRIAFLGDSMVEARQVDLEEGFVSLVEEKLKACPALEGRMPEALNFGAMGYGTTQQYLQLQDRVWQFEPDAVVLGFMLNDVENNSKELEGGSIEPYFLLGSGGQLTLDTSFLQHPTYLKQQRFMSKLAHVFLPRFRIAQLLYAVATRRLAAPTYQPFAEALIGLEPGISKEIYKAPETKAWSDAWTVTEKVLSMMRDAVRAKDAAFGIVTFETGIQVHPDPAVRTRFKESLGIQDLLYPNRRIGALAEREGIPHLLLAEPMRDEAERTGTFFHGFPNTEQGVGHWNEAGHAFIAEQVTGLLCEKVIR